MKKISFVTFLFFSFIFQLSAQTDGTLTFTFTQVPKAPCYSGSRNALAVWIQTDAGGFVKTKLRNCCGGSTKDHLPTYAVNSGGTASNASSANCNKTDAVTGATQTSFGTKTIVWDGKNVNGLVNGTLVADGTYKVTIQSTWNHGSGSTITKSYTFTKGINIDHQTPADDTYSTNVTLDWVPNTNSIASLKDNQLITIYPNPSNNGSFSVGFERANKIEICTMLGVLIYNESTVDPINGIQTIDLSECANGVYFITIINGDKSTKRKIILNKN